MVTLLIHLGFMFWSLRHGGCKHFVQARKSLIRAWKFQGVMQLKNALIKWENGYEIKQTTGRS